jgi:hypothetical protein
MKFALDRIEDPYFYDAILTIMDSNSTDIRNFVSDMELDQILFSNLESQSTSYICKALTIMCKILLFVNRPSPVIVRWQDTARLKSILDIGINSPTDELGEAAFNLINAICIRSECHDDEGDQSAFDRVIDEIRDNCQRVCLYVQRNHSFGIDKRAACQLVTSVMVDTTLPPYLFTYGGFLLSLFLDLKTNSFLHIVFKDFINSVLSTCDGFLTWIDEQEMCAEILKVVGKKDELMASYWGAIREISCTINAAMEKNGQVGSDDWVKFIGEECKLKNDIIAATYGGEVPQIVTVSDGEGGNEIYRCRADSMDIFQVLAANSDPEIIGSEEEEEEEEWEDVDDV